MRQRTKFMRWSACVLCLVLVLSVLTAGALAYPGDGGNKNLYIDDDDTIDGQTVLLYITIQPTDSIAGRPSGDIDCTGTANDGASKVYTAEANIGWVFSHWVTYYEGSAVKEANPKYAYGLGDRYYFSVPGDAEKAFDKTSPTIQINNEWDATGTYHLYAIFRPEIKLEGDVGSTASIRTDTGFYSGSGSVTGNGYSGTAAEFAIAMGNRIPVSVTVNGTATTAYTYKMDTRGGYWVNLALTNVTGPTTVKVTSRPAAFQVVYDANGGAGTMENQTFESGVAEALTANAFTREGWEFAGWNTKADGTGTAYTDKQSADISFQTDGGELTLYAQWKHVAHTGGTATCLEKAVCTTCSAQYGELADHTWSAWTGDGNGNHARACTVDGCDETQTGKCSGGTATCQARAICTDCGAGYGAVSTSHTWSKWTGDGKGNHSRSCTVDGCDQTQTGKCSGGTATCVSKAVCATCDGVYGNVSTSHTWSKWTSDGKGNHSRSCTVDGCTQTQTGKCSGGTATCSRKAVCTTCSGEYGTLKAHTWGKWTSNGNGTHSRVCTVKGCTGKETANCAGGTATCTKKAVCTSCSAQYGSLAAHNYRNTVCTVCGAKDPRYGNPDTADHGAPALWLGMLLVSVGAVAGLVWNRKRWN